MSRGCAFASALASLFASAVSGHDCLDPRSFGAVPGVFEPYDLYWEANTDGIMAALQAAASGIDTDCVSLQGGDFVAAALSIPSNVTLRIERDARLVASANHTIGVFLYLHRVQHVTITGGGAIYGSAERYIDYYQPDPDNRFEPALPDGSRPRLVKVEKSADVVFRGVSILNASDWHLHIQASERVLVDSVEIRGSRQFPNNDGIDPDSSIDVTILNSFIEVADDGICPKATAGMGPLRNLLVRNCTVLSNSHAIKFGSNTDEEMADILFDDIRIRDSNSGIGIQQRSAGDIHNVTWANMDIETRYEAPRWWGNGEWLWISSEARNVGDQIGRVYDLHFANITVRSENGGYISSRSAPVQNLTFSNVSVTLAAWTNYSADGVELCDGPKACRGGFDRRPAPGAGRYGRDAGLAHVLHLENVHGVALHDFSGTFEDRVEGVRPDWFGVCVSKDNQTVDIIGLEDLECLNGLPGQKLEAPLAV